MSKLQPNNIVKAKQQMKKPAGGMTRKMINNAAMQTHAVDVEIWTTPDGKKHRIYFRRQSPDYRRFTLRK